MSENIFIFIALLIFLFFMWILWLRNNLIQNYRTAFEKLSLLKHDREKRRDTIPYLLESAKISKEPSDLWRKIVELRAARNSEMEARIPEFLKESADIKNLNFLEAKKEILELGEHIQKEKFDFDESIKTFNYKKQRFPYSLVSAIFSFRDLET